MSKHVFKIPFWSRVAIHIGDCLPNRIRASIYIDMLESFDDDPSNWRHVVDEHYGESKSYFEAISRVRVATLWNKAHTEGLKAEVIQIDDAPSSATPDGGVEEG